MSARLLVGARTRSCVRCRAGDLAPERSSGSTRALRVAGLGRGRRRHAMRILVGDDIRKRVKHLAAELVEREVTPLNAVVAKRLLTTLMTLCKLARSEKHLRARISRGHRAGVHLLVAASHAVRLLVSNHIREAIAHVPFDLMEGHVAALKRSLRSVLGLRRWRAASSFSVRNFSSSAGLDDGVTMSAFLWSAILEFPSPGNLADPLTRTVLELSTTDRDRRRVLHSRGMTCGRRRSGRVTMARARKCIRYRGK